MREFQFEQTYIDPWDPVDNILIEYGSELSLLKENDTPGYNKKIDTFKMEILDIDKFIKLNPSTKEIKSPVFFQKGGIPTPDGLLSNEIFGITKTDRAGIFGYIDLKGNYLDPSCYKQWCKLDKKIKSIVHQTDTFSINKQGEIIQDPNGSTGIDFLKKNIDKIKWKRNSSIQRDLIIKYLEKNRKNMFINKYIVIPPMYRDVDTSHGKTELGQINKLYSKLISTSIASQSTVDLGFDNSGAIKGTIQETLLQIYGWFLGNNKDDNIEPGTGVAGKFGILRRTNMTKTVDYSSRLVISFANLKVEYTNDMRVNIDRTGIPLATVITIYKPFVLFNLKRFFENEFSEAATYPIYYKGELKRCTPKDWQSTFSDEELEKEMHSFLHSYENRFRPITFNVEEFPEPVTMMFKGRSSKNDYKAEEESIYTRPATWCDVLYMSAVEACKDKVVLITRFPIESPFNQIPSYVEVLSTNQTEPLYYNGVFYKYYPHIKKMDILVDTSGTFQDTCQISTLLLKGMCGDYDGDTVSIKSLFLEESNEEQKKLMNSKQNFIDLDAINIKIQNNDVLQSIYSLTKILPDDKDKITVPVLG